MSINAQKTWAVKNLDVFAGKRIQQALQQTGKALPCHVTGFPKAGVPIVTVAFDLTNVPYTLPNVTCPLFGPEYIRYPIQVGCKGVAFPADAYLGGVSGLGGGTADLSLIGNLTALVFFPVGNSGWAASEDPNALVLYGPDGVIIRNGDSSSSVKITSAGEVLITPKSGQNAQVDGPATVTGNVNSTTGDITADQGNIKATAGNITATNGNISAPLGTMSAASIAAAAISISGSQAANAGNPLLTAAGDVTTTGGFVETEQPITTPTNGSTVTLDPTLSQSQVVSNNVASFTFAAPALSAGQFATVIVRMVNGASAGTPLFTGMNAWPGAALDTTNGHQFVIIFYIWAGVKTSYTIQAQQ